MSLYQSIHGSFESCHATKAFIFFWKITAILSYFSVYLFFTYLLLEACKYSTIYWLVQILHECHLRAKWPNRMKKHSENKRSRLLEKAFSSYQERTVDTECPCHKKVQLWLQRSFSTQTSFILFQLSISYVATWLAILANFIFCIQIYLSFAS